jgi:hypothetical protein
MRGDKDSMHPHLNPLPRRGEEAYDKGSLKCIKISNFFV